MGLGGDPGARGARRGRPGARGARDARRGAPGQRSAWSCPGPRGPP